MILIKNNITVFFLCFIIRILPRLFAQPPKMYDTLFHLFCANLIKKEGYKIPKKIPQVILPHEYSYPYFYHLLLSFIPAKFLKWGEILSSAIFDTINCILIYYFSRWLIDKGNHFLLKDASLWICYLYSFNPLLLRISSGPRAFMGSPRVLGQMFFLAHFISAYYGFSEANILLLICSIMFASLIFLSSKFAVQVLFFFSVTFIVTVSGWYVFIIAAGFIIANILTKGRTISILNGHIEHSSYYYFNLQKKYLYSRIVNINNYFSNFSSCFNTKSIYRIIQSFLKWVFTEKYYLHVLFFINFQFCLLPFYFNVNAIDPLINKFLIWWMINGLIFFLVTQCKPLLFLGESERYLEYAIFPSLFLFVSCFINHNIWIIWIILFYSVFSSVYYILLFIRKTSLNEKNTISHSNFYNKFKSLPEGNVWPIGLHDYEVLTYTNFPVISFGCNISTKLIPLSDLEMLYSNFPYPSNQFNEIINKFKIKYIFTDKDSLNYYIKILDSKHTFDDKAKLILKSGNYLLYEII